MAVLDRADLVNQINTLLPDNNTEDISPADVRSVLGDLVDSDFNLTDDNIATIGGNIATANLTMDGDRTLNGLNTHSLSLGFTGGELADFETNVINSGNTLNINVNSNGWALSGTDGLKAGAVSIGQNGADFQFTSFSTFDQNQFAASTSGAFLKHSNVIMPANFVEVRASDTGILFTDSVNNQGAEYDADYFTGTYPVNNRTIIDSGLIAQFLGGNSLGANAQNPTGGEDGYVLSWNNAFSEYELIPQAGGVNPGTDNFFPIYDNAGTNVEDSRFSQIVTDNLPTITETRFDINHPTANTQRFILGGAAGGNPANNTLTFFNSINVGGRDEYEIELSANGSGLQLLYDNDFGPGWDAASLFLPGFNKRIDLANIFGSEVGTTETYFTGYSGITHFGHKYAGGRDPRPTDANGYSWLSYNDNRLFVGGIGASNYADNAYLVLRGNILAPNQRPALTFGGDPYDQVNGSPDINSLWIDSGNTKLNYKTTAGTDIIIDDITSITKKTSESFNTSGVAGNNFVTIIDSDVNVNSVVNISLDAFINDLSILHIAVGAGQYTIYYNYVAAVVNVMYNVTIA